MSVVVGRELRPLALPALPSEPLVSVIVSNYNYGRFLRDAAASVLSQTYRRLELIICDDGSTDGSRAVIEAIAGADGRVRALYKPNGGQASAWNLALRVSCGEIVCFLDPDDAFLPTKVARVVAAFVAAPESGCCYHRLRVARHDLTPTGDVTPRLLDRGWSGEAALGRGAWGSWPQSSGLSIRRCVAELALPIPDEFRLGYCDAYLEATTQFLTSAVVVEEPLTLYRMHGANASARSVPTVAAITYQLGYHEALIAASSAFIERTFGGDLRQRVRLDDVPGYWEHVLALYVLEGMNPSACRGLTPASVLARVRSPRRRRIWRVILAAPPAVARRMFVWWWSDGALKQRARPLLRVAGVPPA